jgi:hypothetical protein
MFDVSGMGTGSSSGNGNGNNNSEDYAVEEAGFSVGAALAADAAAGDSSSKPVGFMGTIAAASRFLFISQNALVGRLKRRTDLRIVRF